MASIVAFATATPAVAQEEIVLDVIADALAPDLRFTYETVSEGPEGLSAENVEIAPGDADGDDGRVTIARFTISGADAETATADLLPRIDLLTMEGVIFEPKGDRGVARFAEIALSDLVLPTGFLAYLIDDTTDEDAAEEDTADEGAEEEERSLVEEEEPSGPSDDEIFTMIRSLALESAVISGMDTVEPRAGTDSQVLRVDSLRVDGLAEGWIDQIRLEDLRIEDLGILEIDTILFDRLDLIALAQMAIAVRVQEIQDEDAFTLDPGLDRFAILGVSVSDPLGGELATLEGFSVDDVVRVDDEVTQGRVSLDHLAMPIASLDFPPMEAALAEMGYERIDFSFEVRTDIDREERTLAIAPIGFTLDSMAELAVTLEFGNFDLDELLAQVRQMLDTGVPAIPLTTLTGLEIELTDASLTERLIDFQAAQLGQNRSDVIDEVVNVLQSGIDSLSIAGPMRDTLLEQVRSFLTDPGRLTLSAAPSSPVPVVEAGLGLMTSPDATLERLGLQVVAGPVR